MTERRPGVPGGGSGRSSQTRPGRQPAAPPRAAPPRAVPPSAATPRARSAKPPAQVRAAVPARTPAPDAKTPPARTMAPATTVDTHRAAASPQWAPVDPGHRSSAAVTHRVSERIQEKQRVQRRRRMTTAGRRLLVAGIVVGSMWVVLLSPVFDLDAHKVEVSGLGVVVDPAAVDAAVAPYVGQSLTTLNVVHLENQLAEIQGVRHASVARVWPAGLRIEVTTRVPVAAIPDAAGGFVLLDDEAQRVAVIQAVPSDIPVVNIPVGEGSERILDAVITVINALPADLRARVHDVAAPTEDSVAFQLREGPRVEWGSAEQSALKAQVLMVLLQSPQAASAGVIDVSAPTLPTTRAE